jgi:LuxR family transcriptional regulator, transcriptional regulator of spore coat protein
LNEAAERPPVTIVVMLTPREQEVIQLIAQGLSAKQVAQQLNITPRTVESKIERMRLKARARNRTHLIAHAYQQGWI